MVWSIIVSLLVGAFIGWLASLIMNTDEQQGAGGNVLVGIIGSLLGTLIFGSVLGFETAFAAGTLSAAGIFWGLIGAVLLIVLLRSLGVFGHDEQSLHQPRH